MGATERETTPPRVTTHSSDAQRAALERVYLDIVARVERYVRCHLRPGALKGSDMADVTQQIATDLWVRWSRDLAGFEAPTHPQLFAERLVRNHIVDLSEKHARWRTVISHDRSIDDLADAEHIGPLDPHADAVLSELEAILGQRLAELPPKCREAWRLSSAGWTYREVARHLGITASTARSHVHNANRLLIEAVGPYTAEET